MMKSGWIEWALGLALVVAWVAVATQAEHSQRCSAAATRELDDSRVALVGARDAAGRCVADPQRR
jgi:hypothetical protein